MILMSPSIGHADTAVTLGMEWRYMREDEGGNL